MFFGSFTNTLDEKGRVAIPARYREALTAADDDKLMVTTGLEIAGVPCLEAYSLRGWQDFTNELQSKIGQFAHNRLVFESVYIGSAQVCQPDKQGRILLPPSLRNFAELAQEVVFAGVGRKFRIFSAAGHAKMMEAYRAMLRENPDLFRDLGV